MSQQAKSSAGQEIIKIGGIGAPTVFTDIEEVVLLEGIVSLQDGKQLVQGELAKMDPYAANSSF